MSDNRIIPFVYENKSVRVFEYNGQIWFVANDVGKALGMGNIRELIRKVLNENEHIHVTKSYSSEAKAWIYVRNPDKFQTRCTKLVAINESGLYTILMRSSKPKAVMFRQWVTSEVLPSLRKTGYYSINQQNKHDALNSAPRVQTMLPDEHIAFSNNSIDMHISLNLNHFTNDNINRIKLLVSQIINEAMIKPQANVTAL